MISNFLDLLNPFKWIKWLVTVAFLVVATVFLYQQSYVDVKGPIQEGVSSFSKYAEKKGIPIPFVKKKPKPPKPKKGVWRNLGRKVVHTSSVVLDYIKKSLKFVSIKILDAVFSPMMILALIGCASSYYFGVKLFGS